MPDAPKPKPRPTRGNYAIQTGKSMPKRPPPEPIEDRIAAFLELKQTPAEELAGIAPLLSELKAEIERLGRQQDRDDDVFIHNQGESKDETLEGMRLQARWEALVQLERDLVDLRTALRLQLK